MIAFLHVKGSLSFPAVSHEGKRVRGKQPRECARMDLLKPFFRSLVQAPMATVKLDVVQVKNPCPANWNQMAGTSASRFCGTCQKHVHNLSTMYADQAERLLCESAGKLCVRFARDDAGTMITLDYQPPRRKARGWRSWTLLALVLALVSGTTEAVLYGKGTAPFGSRRPPAGRVMVMGDIAPTRTPSFPPVDGDAPGRTFVTGEAPAVCPKSTAVENPTLP